MDIVEGEMQEDQQNDSKFGFKEVSNRTWL